MEQKNQSKKKAVIAFAVTAIIVLVFGTIIAVNVILNNKGDGTTEDKVDINIIKAVAEYNSASIIKGDENNGVIDEHVRGNANAKVLVVEYADLQCPGCAAMMTSVHNLYIQYSDEVMFVFRNFPINGHPNARPAAAAAEAAGFQGRYWEMLETLYANRADWYYAEGEERVQAFANLFKEIAPDGDVDKFKSDLGDPRIEKKIDFDYSLGRYVDGVKATPAFYVNGEAIDISKVETIGEVAELLESKIQSAIESAKE